MDGTNGQVRDHVLSGWLEEPGTALSRPPTPWISTSSDFEWARVSRIGGTYELTVIHDQIRYSRNYRGAKMIRLGADQALRDLGYNHSDKGLSYARSSAETLWYGRIFPKDIIERTEWSSNVGHRHTRHI